MAQHFALGVHQQNAEGVEGHQRMSGLGDLAQQFVQIENRAEFLRQMRQRLERAVLAVDAAVEPRIVDGHRHARGDQLQQRAILLAISVQARGLQIDHAHQLAARQHGHGQFGLHGVQSRQIARIVANVGRPGWAGGWRPRRR